MSEYVDRLETILGRTVVPRPCPRSCHGGYIGMDNCNKCGCTGSVIYVNATAFPNTEEGWREALALAVSERIVRGTPFYKKIQES